MKTCVLLVCVVLVGMATTGLAAENALPGPMTPRTAEQFAPREVADLLALPAEMEIIPGSSDTIAIQADVLPSRVRAGCASESRLLSESRSAVLHYWAARYASNMEGFTIPFVQEWRFTAGEATFWVCVRTRDKEPLATALRGKKDLELFLTRVGGEKTDSGWEWVFLLDRFAE